MRRRRWDDTPAVSAAPLAPALVDQVPDRAGQEAAARPADGRRSTTPGAPFGSRSAARAASRRQQQRASAADKAEDQVPAFTVYFSGANTDAGHGNGGVKRTAGEHSAPRRRRTWQPAQPVVPRGSASRRQRRASTGVVEAAVETSEDVPVASKWQRRTLEFASNDGPAVCVPSTSSSLSVPADEPVDVPVRPLVLRLCSTLDPDALHIGLDRIEIVDSTGAVVPLSPDQITGPGPVAKLLSRSHASRWSVRLSAHPLPINLAIRVSSRHPVAMLRVWNYNRNVQSVGRGVARLCIHTDVDDEVVATADLATASGMALLDAPSEVVIRHQSVATHDGTGAAWLVDSSTGVASSAAERVAVTQAERSAVAQDERVAETQAERCFLAQGEQSSTAVQTEQSSVSLAELSSNVCPTERSSVAQAESLHHQWPVAQAEPVAVRPTDVVAMAQSGAERLCDVTVNVASIWSSSSSTLSSGSCRVVLAGFQLLDEHGAVVPDVDVSTAEHGKSEMHDAIPGAGITVAACFVPGRDHVLHARFIGTETAGRVAAIRLWNFAAFRDGEAGVRTVEVLVNAQRVWLGDVPHGRHRPLILHLSSPTPAMRSAIASMVWYPSVVAERVCVRIYSTWGSPGYLGINGLGIVTSLGSVVAGAVARVARRHPGHSDGDGVCDDADCDGCVGVEDGDGGDGDEDIPKDDARFRIDNAVRSQAGCVPEGAASEQDAWLCPLPRGSVCNIDVQLPQPMAVAAVRVCNYHLAGKPESTARGVRILRVCVPAVGLCGQRSWVPQRVPSACQPVWYDVPVPTTAAASNDRCARPVHCPSGTVLSVELSPQHSRRLVLQSICVFDGAGERLDLASMLVRIACTSEHDGVEALCDPSVAWSAAGSAVITITLAACTAVSRVALAGVPDPAALDATMSLLIMLDGAIVHHTIVPGSGAVASFDETDDAEPRSVVTPPVFWDDGEIR